MADVVILDSSLIDRLIATLRVQGAPMVDHLNAGLSDDEMNALVAPLGISLPDEARVWWHYANGVTNANGVPPDAPSSIDLSPSWSWAPLEEIVAECREMRQIGNEDVLPGEPSVYRDSWLPIVLGDGMLVMDTSQSVIAPAGTVDFADYDLDDTWIPDLPSLGALVQAWTSALETRAVWYDHDQQLFNVYGDRLDALGIPIALV